MALKEKIIGFYEQCKRVWYVLKKPTKQEFWTVAKVAGIGILVIGAIGFLVSLVVSLF